MSGRILGVEDLLGRFRAEGETESSGAFTLDPRKAMERLAQFQLPSRYHWILKIIQAANLAKANNVSIKAGVRGVDLVCDAVPPGFSTVDDLLAHLIADDEVSSPALRHLAAGLQGSLAVRPRSIEAIVKSGGRQSRFLLVSGGWRTAATEEVSDRQTRFEVRLRRNWSEQLDSGWFTLNTDILDYVLRRPSSYDRENKTVYDACHFADCDVLIKGRMVSRRPFGAPRFPGYDIRTDLNPGTRRAPLYQRWTSGQGLIKGAVDRRHHLAEFLQPAIDREGFRLANESHATVTNRYDPGVAEASQKWGFERAFALRAELSPLAILLFLEDGVIIQQQTLSLGCPGLIALINAKSFRKDVSTFKIVEDESFHLLLTELSEVGKKLRSQVLENLNSMPCQGHIKRHLS